MLLAEQFALGDLRGVMYTFEKSGEVLEKHIHDESNVHITIVARGKVRIQSHDWNRLAVAGQLVDLRAGEPHEIVAVEDGTRIFNIIKKMGGGTLAAEGAGMTQGQDNSAAETPELPALEWPNL